MRRMNKSGTMGQETVKMRGHECFKWEQKISELAHGIM